MDNICLKTVSCALSPSPKQNAAVLTRVKGTLRRFAPLTRAPSCGSGNPRATGRGMPPAGAPSSGYFSGINGFSIKIYPLLMQEVQIFLVQLGCMDQAQEDITYICPILGLEK